MKILLVRPWVNKHITTVRNYLVGEPLGIICVGTIMKTLGHEVVLADFMIEKNGKIEKYLKDFKPDIVGITSQCSDVVNVTKIAKTVKKFNPNIKVIVGGIHAMCFPEAFFMPEVDFIFKSTTKENVKKLMGNIENNNLQERIDGIYSKALEFKNDGDFCCNDYIVPDRSISAKYRHKYRYVGFQPCAIVLTAFGCRNRCKFCIRWHLEGKLQEIPIEEIVEQIENINEPYIMICDNDFLIHRSRLEKFCDLLEEKNIKKEFVCYGSVNSILEKPQIIERLQKNGLKAVIVGIEAFDNERFSEYNKPTSVDDNYNAIKILHDNNVACWGSFIVHPDWDKSDFKKMIDYLRDLKIELCTFSPLVPHPLTPLYEEYKDRLIYTVEDYEKWNFGDVLIRPSKMSLREYYFEIIKLALKLNGAKHSIQYVRKNFSLKNNLSMLFGFKTLFSIYVKNMLTKK